jgi:hypothetical protein
MLGLGLGLGMEWDGFYGKVMRYVCLFDGGEIVCLSMSTM